jgi:hypothetical protein
MNTPLLYEEVQTFGQRWLHQFLKLSTAVLLGCNALLLLTGTAEKEGLTTTLLTGTFIIIVVSLLLYSTKLITQIRADGIYVRYPPLQPAFTVCTWDTIAQVYIRKYNPLLEYGGWGIRYSPQGKAYNVSGNTGLQILFKDGTKLLIGTADAESLARILLQMDKLDIPLS